MSDQSRQQPAEVPEKRISSQAGLAALRQGATLAGRLPVRRPGVVGGAVRKPPHTGQA